MRPAEFMNGSPSVIEAPASRPRDALRLEEKHEVVGVLSRKLSAINGRAPLQLQENRSLGAKDSAHDVFFAETVPSNSEIQSKQYACKRFRREENAEREVRGFQIARERGFRTLTPSGEGIYPVDGIGHVLVTEHIPRFTTMNQIGWQDYFAGQPDYESKIVPSLEGIASFTARMHRSGIIHDDLQLKNIGQVPPVDFVLFDLEGASYFNPITENTPPTSLHAEKAIADVGTLVNSLVCRGFLWNSTDQTFTNEIIDHLLMPYLLQSKMPEDMVIEGFDSIISNAHDMRQQVHHEWSQAVMAA